MNEHFKVNFISLFKQKKEVLFSGKKVRTWFFFKRNIFKKETEVLANMESSVQIMFIDQPDQNHEMFFSYDNKKEKCLCGERTSEPMVKIFDNRNRSGVLKVACIDHEPIKSNVYRLHRHKLVDFSNKTNFCDEFGVASFPFDYYQDQAEFKLKNLSIRRINENELNDVMNKWFENKNKFDPFGIEFGTV